MAARLTELVRLADQLARDARPARARILEYLCLTPFADLWRMPPVPPSRDLVIRRVAEELGDSPEIVRHELAEFFRLDLRDYSRDYASERQFFEAHPRLGKEAVEFLGEMFLAPEVLYLLHGVLCGWHPESLEASGGIIIEGIDYGDQDDRFCSAIEGYLVSRGMAFGSEVEVLAASFYDRWPSWDEFWDRYHGWSEHWGDEGP